MAREGGNLELIPDGHKMLGDKIYKVKELREKITAINDDDSKDIKTHKSRCLARHETVNARIKSFAVLRDFRCKNGKKKEHSKMKKHRDCFEAVVVLTQYNLENDHPLFDV